MEFFRFCYRTNSFLCLYWEATGRICLPCLLLAAPNRMSEALHRLPSLCKCQKGLFTKPSLQVERQTRQPLLPAPWASLVRHFANRAINSPCK